MALDADMDAIKRLAEGQLLLQLRNLLGIFEPGGAGVKAASDSTWIQHRHARAWLNAKSQESADWPLSYCNSCELLGLDAKPGRELGRAVDRWIETGGACPAEGALASIFRGSPGALFEAAGSLPEGAAGGAESQHRSRRGDDGMTTTHCSELCEDDARESMACTEAAATSVQARPAAPMLHPWRLEAIRECASRKRSIGSAAALGVEKGGGQKSDAMSR